MAANPIVPTPELQIETTTTATETTFHVTGKIVSATAIQFRDAVKSLIPEKKTIILDFSGVSYVDSSGLGTLVGIWVSAQREQCDLKLVHVSDRLKELLRLTKLDKLFSTSTFPDSQNS